MNQSYYPSQDPISKFNQEMKFRRFSPKTIKSYLHYITDLLAKSNKNTKTVTSKIETTQIYNKVANTNLQTIKSPLD